MDLSKYSFCVAVNRADVWCAVNRFMENDQGLCKMRRNYIRYLRWYLRSETPDSANRLFSAYYRLEKRYDCIRKNKFIEVERVEQVRIFNTISSFEIPETPAKYVGGFKQLAACSFVVFAVIGECKCVARVTGNSAVRYGGISYRKNELAGMEMVLESQLLEITSKEQPQVAA